MTPAETTKLIRKAGGDAAFGRLLGIDEKPGWIQRVNNWKRRGLPAAVIAQHYKTLERLRESSEKAA